jgi:hypothetical protein
MVTRNVQFKMPGVWSSQTGAFGRAGVVWAGAGLPGSPKQNTTVATQIGLSLYVICSLVEC